ncbi:hypothetical protein [Paenibacillus agri]|uniref:DUF1837 domain-containing protein n=1 Tax=Paenibacillus agri TaxID=2744309 RepID=A0A850EQ11_9BACL|nr:hypothetical protein [Paenibacillus agri]NUU63045.1 hypothetical protein [Paenibacillus agri]
MTLPIGKNEYLMGSTPVFGYGVSYSELELDVALSGPVAEIVFDIEGTADLTDLLDSVIDTDFDRNELKRVLESEKKPENWRVGEALAELFLTCHKACCFPWPDGRDERKSGSSLPGADLVGFKEINDDAFFTFGEVKTSTESGYPPGAMYGRTGLKQQLEDLRDKVGIRDDLVRYLGHRAVTASWKDLYIRAFKKYISNNKSVHLFGLLVRDVKPHEDDLRVRVLSLGKDCSNEMSIELHALYLPEESISKLSEKVMATKREGAK